MLARAGYPNLRANAVDAMFHFADACARAARMNAGAGAGARAEDVIDARDATRGARDDDAMRATTRANATRATATRRASTTTRETSTRRITPREHQSPERR